MEKNKTWSFNDPNLSEFNPNNSSRVISYIHKNCTVSLHSHDFFEINIVVKGSGYHILENKSIYTSLGQIFVLPPQLKHGYKSSGDLDVYHILLSSAFMEKYRDEIKSLPNYTTFFDIEPYIRDKYNLQNIYTISTKNLNTLIPILNNLITLQTLDLKSKNLAIEHYALTILHLIFNFYEADYDLAKRNNSGTSYIPDIIKCLEMLQVRFAEKWTLDSLAKYCNMSRSTMLRQFKYTCNCSPKEYINKLRIRNAKKLLKTTTYSITRIAQDCGFFDSTHFSQSFKKHTGYLPLEYRKRKSAN